MKVDKKTVKEIAELANFQIEKKDEKDLNNRYAKNTGNGILT